MVVDHIHDHTDALPVARHHELAEFTDPHLTVERIGAVRALENIVIERVVAPVELRQAAALVHGREVKNRKQMNMSNAE